MMNLKSIEGLTTDSTRSLPLGIRDHKIFKDVPTGLKHAFFVFHGEHPEVYNQFCKYAYQARYTSKKEKISAEDIWNRTKWYFDHESPGEERLKIPKRVLHLYKRYLIVREPEFAAVFKFYHSDQ